MAALAGEIREWFARGKKGGATHMLVVSDSFSYEDYPVYIQKTDDIGQKAKAHSINMQTVRECYDLKMDLEIQMKQSRSWNGWRP